MKSIADCAETGHSIYGHWKCQHASRIDLERVLMSGLGDLPARALKVLRCPTCGASGPCELRVCGPINEEIAAQKRRDASEREAKVVRFKPKR